MSDDEYSTLDRAQEFVEALSSFHDSFRDAEIAHLGKIMELTWSLRSNESYDSLAENNDILRALKFDGQTKQNSEIISNETDKVNSAELLKRYGVTKERENCSTYIPPVNRSPPKQMLRYRDNVRFPIINNICPN